MKIKENRKSIDIESNKGSRTSQITRGKKNEYAYGETVTLKPTLTNLNKSSIDKLSVSNQLKSVERSSNLPSIGLSTPTELKESGLKKHKFSSQVNSYVITSIYEPKFSSTPLILSHCSSLTHAFCR